MSRHDAVNPIFDAPEHAAMLAAGAAAESEYDALASAVGRGDPAAGAAAVRLAPVADLLAAGVPVVPPPAIIKQKLLERIREDQLSRQPRTAEAAAIPGGPAAAASDEIAPILTLRSDEGTWAETGSPGVRMKTLLANKRDKRITLLVQMDPGSHYPDHHHDGVEECYVISGDLHIAGTVLRAGDFQRAIGDTDHGPSWTEGGCLLLITLPLAA